MKLDDALARLRPYQTEMIQRIETLDRVGLFAPMGSGKTPTVLCAVAKMFREYRFTGPVLVLAPLRVARSTWPVEAAKWVPHLTVSVICGSPAQRIAAVEQPADIYTTNYENIEWLVDHCGDHWPFTMIVADEWTRLKSFRTRQGGKRAGALAAVAVKTPRFIGMTGSPAANGLMDLWGQVWFADFGARLGRSFYAFASRYFHKDFSGFRWVLNEGASEKIQAAIADICHTVNLAAYVDVREPVFNQITVDLPKAARVKYDEIAGEEIDAKNAAVKSVKLLQMANGAVYTPDAADPFAVIHDEKLDALESLIEEQAGAPLMVAYYLKSDLARLVKRFPSARVMDTDPQTVTDFNAGRIPVLLVHPASAGHGLSLHESCNAMAFFGLGWSLEQYEQVIERIGPMRQLQAGYDRPVFVHHIVARDTVDEIVLARLRSKSSVQQILIDALRKRGSQNVIEHASVV